MTSNSRFSQLSPDEILIIANFADIRELYNFKLVNKRVLLSIEHPDTDNLIHKFPFMKIFNANFSSAKILNLNTFRYNISDETAMNYIINNFQNAKNLFFGGDGIYLPEMKNILAKTGINVYDVCICRICSIYKQYHNRFHNVMVKNYKYEQFPDIDYSITKILLSRPRKNDMTNPNLLKNLHGLTMLDIYIQHYISFDQKIDEFIDLRNAVNLKYFRVKNDIITHAKCVLYLNLPLSCKYVHLETYVEDGKILTNFVHPEHIEYLELYIMDMISRDRTIKEYKKFIDNFQNLKKLYVHHEQTEYVKHLKGYHFEIVPCHYIRCIETNTHDSVDYYYGTDHNVFPKCQLDDAIMYFMR